MAGRHRNPQAGRPRYDNMKELSSIARRHVDAAEGWVGLGSLQDAADELELISPRLRAHPDVLNVRFKIFSAAEKWDACLDVATTLARLAPDRCDSWMCFAFSLRKLGRVGDARAILLKVVAKFAMHWVVCYELAHCCCLLKRIEEGRAWFGKAIDLVVDQAEATKVKLSAVQDDEMAPLFTTPIPGV